MRWEYSLFMVVLISSQASAEAPPPAPADAAAPVFSPAEVVGSSSPLFAQDPAEDPQNGPLTGNHNFRNFIGFMSNPLESIDPRAVTAIYPIFGNEWVKTASPVPDGDFQLYGPALTVALTDRLAVGLNQGGYAVANFSKNQRDRIFLDESRFGLLRNQDFSGYRSGWLNLGGFAQYTMIEDVPDQFLLTGGLRWEAPCGSHDVFQGNGPPQLAPYLTFGKEYGDYHVLGTTGFQFPAAAGNRDTELFYANLHLDRRMFGWLYPLVEFNCIYHTTSVDFGLPTRRGLIDFGNFESSGNIVTLAAGANAVIIPERLEFGAVYTTVIATQRDFDANGLLVKMVIRY